MPTDSSVLLVLGGASVTSRRPHQSLPCFHVWMDCPDCFVKIQTAVQEVGIGSESPHL